MKTRLFSTAAMAVLLSTYAAPFPFAGLLEGAPKPRRYATRRPYGGSGSKLARKAANGQLGIARIR